LSDFDFIGQGYELPWRFTQHNLPHGESTEWSGPPLGQYVVRSCSVECAGLVTAGYATFALEDGTVFWAVYSDDLSVVFEAHRDQMYFPVDSSSAIVITNNFPGVSIDVCASGIFVPGPTIVV
jgi:hypothetical protein